MGLRLLAELVPLLAAALAALCLPSVRPSVWAAPSHLLRRFARTPRQAIVWSALLSFAVCPIFSWVTPPSPHVHDEFSYLLAADTFARGRLTNPTHPLWQHFETLYIIHTPTYQSKYPPAQALVLAVGQVLTGRPIVGVWLSVAAGAAAVCWMLLAWVPPRWALFGALLPAFRFGALPLWDNPLWFAYWNTSFWGGAVAMAGGALLLGSLARLLRKPRLPSAVAFSAGLIVLAASRPFEGVLMALVAAFPLGWFWLRRPAWRKTATRFLVPAAAVFAIGAMALGYYHFRVTGNPLKMPYSVNNDQYETVPLFTFQGFSPDKAFRHDVFQAHSNRRKRAYDVRMQGLATFLAVSRSEFAEILDFFWGAALWVALPWLLPRPWSPWVLFAAGLISFLLFASWFSVQPQLLPHYLAPAAPAFVVLAVAGLRRARGLRLGARRVGRALSEAIVAVSLTSFILACALRANRGPQYPSPLSQYRPLITTQLKTSPGKDLVIVTYGPSHDMHDEWVYNGADLDRASIVWARDMGRQANQELLDYYSGRQIWRLYADEKPPRLQPYNATAD